jgi:hypothetical protein
MDQVMRPVDLEKEDIRSPPIKDREGVGILLQI